MRRSILGVIVAAVLLAPRGAGQENAAHERSPSAPPNVVFFLVDDMGWQDTSVPFHVEATALNRRYRTPAMARLAARGRKFTQAYVSSICSPTRVSLMTGLNAARHRVTSWTLRRDRATDAEHPRLVPPRWNVNGLSPVEDVARTVHAVPLAQRLRDAGYRTLHVGKAHFGAADTPGADPLNLGFSANVAGHAAGAPGSHLGSDDFTSSKRQGREGPSVWDVPGLEKYHGKDVFLTEALTLEAVALMRESARAERPFFLYLAHYAVHTPIMADPRFVEAYPGLDPIEAAYASMIEGMDTSLGCILDELDRLEIADSTVIVFLSDNGGLTSVARGGERFTHNLPLSSGKGSAREGGTRVPMLVSWPGVTAAGSKCDTPVIVEDLYPTLLDIAGIDIPVGLDGKTFVPALRGEPLDHSTRAFVWHQPNNWVRDEGPGIGAHSAIRRGDLKLIAYHDPEREPRIEVFDLAADIGETTNLADPENAAHRALRGLLADELTRLGAQMPTDRRTGKPIALPDF